ncbi:MAG TPA: tRNA (adenosine(37)-N6)-dimethylallyltransferase MiaA [Candidatus Paceibacterota bacterium]|nr:tRNA (adenosine(37)-N6)-dimethylallyltransferase MiaA [Candidatus Paceibacterota bacterium]
MNPSKRPKVLAIVGPTASGKSALGVILAKKFGGEIISADSRQVYRGLDIGTGKITKREMRGIPHYLLDVASPKKIFTASDFVRAGNQALEKIQCDRKLPIIVGGTGFYIDALLGEIVLPDVPPNATLRAKLEKMSTDELYALLQRRDKQRAATIEPHHKRRLIRALEIAHVLGKNPQPQKSSRFDVLWIGIKPPAQELEDKIKTRLNVRIKIGMIAEAKRLHAGGLSYKRMEALGLEYRALARLLQKKINRAQFEAELFREIRKYAKRQITYWKRNKKITWFDPRENADIEKRVAQWLHSTSEHEAHS